MPRALLELGTVMFLETAAANQAVVRGQVQLALHGRSPRRGAAERRRLSRYPYPYPVHLTSTDQDALASENTIIVLGRHISECGLDFYCHQPLTDRRMIASLSWGDDRWVGLVLELTWCRFSQHGWYNHGGRFVGTAHSPLEQQQKQDPT